MYRLSTSVDAAFRCALSGDSTRMDAVIAAERAERNAPGLLMDRLVRLQAHHRTLAMYHADCLVQADRYWPKPMKDRARVSMQRHDAAAKCLRRRIDRLVKRGAL